MFSFVTTENSSGVSKSRTGTYSTVVRKGRKKFFGIRVKGESTVLQGPDSDIKLYIPPGMNGVISGRVHTDPTPFIHAIPKSECLIAPIVDYHVSNFSQHSPSVTTYKIEIPHCIKKKDLNSRIIVRHGDIYSDTRFTELPSDDSFFEVAENYIIIQTTHFSQFVCTSCKRVCEGEAVSFIFGSITPVQYKPIHAALRLYTCSPLYTILDFRKVRFIHSNFTTVYNLMNS